MSEEILKKIIQYNTSSYNKNIDYSGALRQIEDIYNIKKSELEAKIYTYEKIIANSNFKSILSKDKQSLEKRINELEKQVKELEEISNI